MFGRIISRSLLRQRARHLLIALTVALGVSLSTALLSVMFNVGDKVNAELQAYGANIVVRPQGTAVVNDLYGQAGTTAGAATLKESELGRIKTIFWAFNILNFAPFLQTQASLQCAGCSGATTVQAVGTWFDKHLDLPTGESLTTGVQPMRSWWDVTGAWIQDSGANQAMVGANLAQRQHIQPGQQLTLAVGGRTRTLTVVGIFSSGGAEDDTLVVPLPVVQDLAQQPDAVGWIEVSALTTPDNNLARTAARDPSSLSARDWETWYCTAYVSSISYQIEEVITGSVAKPVHQVADSQGMVLSKTQLLMLLITALSLVGTALGIANLITASVMERSPQIGLLKAIGATDRAIVGLFLTEIVIVGLVGGAVGFAAGLGLAQVIGASVFGSSIAFTPLVIPIMGALVVVVCLAGSLPSIRLLLSLRPAEVLHGR